MGVEMLTVQQALEYLASLNNPTVDQLRDLVKCRM